MDDVLDVSGLYSIKEYIYMEFQNHGASGLPANLYAVHWGGTYPGSSRLMSWWDQDVKRNSPE